MRRLLRGEVARCLGYEPFAIAMRDDAYGLVRMTINEGPRGYLIHATRLDAGGA